MLSLYKSFLKISIFCCTIGTLWYKDRITLGQDNINPLPDESSLEAPVVLLRVRVWGMVRVHMTVRQCGGGPEVVVHVQHVGQQALGRLLLEIKLLHHRGIHSTGYSAYVRKYPESLAWNIEAVLVIKIFFLFFPFFSIFDSSRQWLILKKIIMLFSNIGLTQLWIRAFILFCIMMVFLVIFSPGLDIRSSHGIHCRNSCRTYSNNISGRAGYPALVGN